MHALILFALCLGAFIVIGAADGRAPDGPVGEIADAIVGPHEAAPPDPRAPTPLTALDTADAARDWQAVGRLDLAGAGFCTGALIAPDVVLTAAHCVRTADGADLIPAADVSFLAGVRDGRAAAYRGARRVVTHPAYRPGAESDLGFVAYDLALVELDRPIRRAGIAPFDVGPRPRKGEQVGIVSYAKGRAARPSLQEVCNVLARRSGSLVMSCDVDFGASGAPVFSLGAEGPRIVSVVSAKGVAAGREVSFGTGLADPLAEVQAALDAARAQGGAHRAATSAPPDGAKFLRP